jgi:transcriptional regulator of met regulon
VYNKPSIDSWLHKNSQHANISVLSVLYEAHRHFGCSTVMYCAAAIAVNALTVLTAERARRSSISVHRVAETETTTFMDCVNCLIAFTNNPHR